MMLKTLSGPALLPMLLCVCTGQLDYMVAVEQPVTLVANTLVERDVDNGTCCSPEGVVSSPSRPTGCTICPDDPIVEFRLLVCFRPGFVVGFTTDASYCPLGGVDFTPNRPPGPVSALSPRWPEAGTLPRQYPGSVQLYVRITAIVGGAEFHLDDVWVFGVHIPPDGVFRRIAYLSFKQVAIVGVNVRVQCTNGAETIDCSFPTETMSDAASNATTPDTATSQEETTTDSFSSTYQEETTTTDALSATTAASIAQSDTPSTMAANTQLGNIQNQITDPATPQGGGAEASSSNLSSVSIVIGLCIGVLLATVITALLFSLITYHIRRKYKMLPAEKNTEMAMSANPVYANKQCIEKNEVGDVNSETRERKAEEDEGEGDSNSEIEGEEHVYEIPSL